MKHRLLLLFLLIPWTALPAGPRPEECGPHYAGTAELNLDVLQDALTRASRDGALRAEVGRGVSTVYIDYLVEGGDRFASRQQLGSDKLEVDWVEDARMYFFMSNAVRIADEVGRPIRVIEGYATDRLGEVVRSGDFDLERASRLFSRLRGEPWTFSIERRGARTYLVGRRGQSSP